VVGKRQGFFFFIFICCTKSKIALQTELKNLTFLEHYVFFWQKISLPHLIELLQTILFEYRS